MQCINIRWATSVSSATIFTIPGSFSTFISKQYQSTYLEILLPNRPYQELDINLKRQWMCTENSHFHPKSMFKTKTLQVFGGKLLITIYGMCSFRSGTCPRFRFSCAMDRAGADISVEWSGNFCFSFLDTAFLKMGSLEGKPAKSGQIRKFVGGEFIKII